MLLIIVFGLFCFVCYFLNYFISFEFLLMKRQGASSQAERTVCTSTIGCCDT